MKFALRQKIVLRANDGTVIKAAPFYFTSTNGSGLQVEFYAEDGTPIHCVDKEQGLYKLGDLHTLLCESPKPSQPMLN